MFSLNWKSKEKSEESQSISLGSKGRSADVSSQPRSLSVKGSKESRSQGAGDKSHDASSSAKPSAQPKQGSEQCSEQGLEQGLEQRSHITDAEENVPETSKPEEDESLKLRKVYIYEEFL